MGGWHIGRSARSAVGARPSPGVGGAAHPAPSSRSARCYGTGGPLTACRCSGLLDRFAYDPGVLADLPDAGEAVLLDKFGCCAEQEAALRPAAGGHLGTRLTSPPPRWAIWSSTPSGGARDALTAVLLVDEEAGDPPVWRCRSGLVVLSPVRLMPGSSPGLAVLAPALRGVVLVDDKRGMRAVVGPGAVVRHDCARVRPGHLGGGNPRISSRREPRCCARRARPMWMRGAAGSYTALPVVLPAVSAAPPAQECSAACASRRASSAGALIMGQ
jgi:hypothetical protein